MRGGIWGIASELATGEEEENGGGGGWFKSDIGGTELLEKVREDTGKINTIEASKAQSTTRTSVVLYSLELAVAGFLCGVLVDFSFGLGWVCWLLAGVI